MITYWLLFLIATWAALKSRAFAGHVRILTNEKWSPAWRMMFLLLLLLIGLRHEVGGDWLTYLDHVDSVRGMSLAQAFLQGGDPAYVLLNWLSTFWGMSI